MEFLIYNGIEFHRFGPANIFAEFSHIKSPIWYMKVICITYIKTMDISISLEVIIEYVSNISINVFIHESANSVIIYVSYI